MPVTYLNPGPQEIKYIGRVLTGDFASVSTTGALYDMCSNIAEGAEINQRIGRSIKLRSLDVYGTLIGGQINLVTDDRYNTVRITVFTGQPGLLPASINWNLNAIADPRTCNGVERVLYDEVVTLRSFSRDSTGYMPAQKGVRFCVPLKGRRQLFSGLASGSQSCSTVYLYMVSDSAAITNPGFVSGVASISWIDD